MNETIIKNPITDWIRNSISNSKERLNFAVPFLSSFANTLLDKQTTCNIEDKRIITRFDDSSLSSFDLPTLKNLLDLGFTIQYDNSIHLKLYIADNEVFITSSNFTKGGFEDNIELTVKTDSNNTQNCIDIFNEIWINCSKNKLTYDLIDNNWAKYEVLRKREKYVKKEFMGIKTKPIKVGEFDLQKIIDEIFNQKTDYSKTEKLVFEANKLRERTKEKLMQGHNSLIFYAPEGHEFRRENLFYDFVYGYEYDLAGTGLRELQFQTAFEHPSFEKAVNYIFPEMLGLKSWNLNDKNEFQEFCNGIFDFDIPQYTEALPIRLASYFYPGFFIPIFKIEHLKKVCETLGLETDAKTRGDKIFVYNTFLAHKMKTLPYGNYIKSNISYLILFTVELYNRLNNGETFENIINDYKEKWKKGLIESGKDLLTKLKIIE